MKIYILKKEKTKKYDSKAICKSALDFDLEYDGNKPVGCSISDTNNYWACAIGECGLDIEESGRTVKQSTVKALHEKEQTYLNGLNYGTSEWKNEFLNIWTAKEAYYKLFGLSFKRISVLDEKLEYKNEEQGFIIKRFEYKSLCGCIISRPEDGSSDFEVEIVPIKFAGKTAKPCIDYAADLIAVRAYSANDLEKKLEAKGYLKEESFAAVTRLKELGYIDDSAYAVRLLESAIASGKGNNYIREKLKQSGIKAEDMPDFPPEDERALMQLEKLKGKTPEQIGRRLFSLGYSPSVVYKVLSKIRNCD